MRKLTALLLLLVGTLWCQQSPDCSFTVTFTSATAQSPAYSNRPLTTGGLPCTSWVVSYFTNGATGVSVQIEGAADSAGAPTGAWAALTAATSPVISHNPATGTTGGNILACCDYYPWIRINPTTFTGTNQTMTVRVYGYRGTAQVASGGGGGAPSGPAGGDLSGTYPNPNVANLSHVTNSSLANTGLVNPSMTVNGTSCTLGGSCTVAGTAGLTLVEQHTAANSASLAFTTCFTSTYDNYLITFQNFVPATAGSELQLQVSTNGGVSYDTGANYTSATLQWIATTTSTSGGGAAQTRIQLMPNVSGNTSYGATGWFTMSNPLSASIFKLVFGSGLWLANDGNFLGQEIAGAYASATAVNAFRIIESAGNITSGTARCYGFAK